MRLKSKKRLRRVTRTLSDAGLMPEPASVDQAAIARARAYAERTHDTFLLSLRKSDELGNTVYGVLAGPLKRSPKS